MTIYCTALCGDPDLTGVVDLDAFCTHDIEVRCEITAYLAVWVVDGDGPVVGYVG